MPIIKNIRRALIEERMKNEELTAQLAKEKEKVQFLGLLAADVDVDELFEEGEAEND